MLFSKANHIMKLIGLFSLCFIGLSIQAHLPQKARPVNILFIGNSYTFFNNMPQICVGLAASTGDVLAFDQNTPGGYSFYQHVSDSNTILKIMKGYWDYVVLQESSRIPSYPDDEVAKYLFPYAHYLDSLVHKYNKGAKTLFYMTWGRKKGDNERCKTWPPVCTYPGMDSLIALRYTEMAKMYHAELAPVGAVWRYLRDRYPSMELYLRDESHPSEAGSYAAACCFYTVIFRKDPEMIKYNFTLSSSDAKIIRKAVRKVVFDNLPEWENN
jgi:hypothetical protein